MCCDLLVAFSIDLQLPFSKGLSEKAVEKCQCISELPAAFLNPFQLHNWLPSIYL